MCPGAPDARKLIVRTDEWIVFSKIQREFSPGDWVASQPNNWKIDDSDPIFLHTVGDQSFSRFLILNGTRAKSPNTHFGSDDLSEKSVIFAATRMKLFGHSNDFKHLMLGATVISRDHNSRHISKRYACGSFFIIFIIVISTFKYDKQNMANVDYSIR